MVWATCAGLALTWASTMVLMNLAGKESKAFYDSETGQVPEAAQLEIARSFGLFVCWFGGVLAGSSAVAFTVIGLAGLRTERRRPERRKLIARVEMETERASYVANTENISTGGLFVATDHTHSLGERMKLRLQLPGQDTPLTLEAEVRWIRRSAATEGVAVTGIGLLFVGLTSQAVGAIRRFLA
jgi:uncharacterized protein (TIGR02266 family)